jgi:hypothetical protein
MNPNLRKFLAEPLFGKGGPGSGPHPGQGKKEFHGNQFAGKHSMSEFKVPDSRHRENPGNDPHGSDPVTGEAIRNIFGSGG